MLLAIDMGNTCVTLGFFKGEKLQGIARMACDRTRTEDQYAIDIKDIIALNGFSASEFSGAVLCSVVPVLTSVIERAVKKVTGITVLTVGPGVKTGLNIKLDNPAQLGADLVAGAVAAIAHYTLPCVIFDLGTATTISVIDEKANFIGGMITAGIGISLDVLVGRTSQLPFVDLDSPGALIGTNTIDSMKSGIIYGTASMLDGMTDRIEAELGQKVSVIATGGRSGQVFSFCRHKAEQNDHLLLDGLRLIYNKNYSN